MTPNLILFSIVAWIVMYIVTYKKVNMGLKPFEETLDTKYINHPVFFWAKPRSIIFFFTWIFPFAFYLIRAIILGVYKSLKTFITEEWKIK